MILRACFALLCLIAAGCSPLHTSPHDERHQWELTIHEVQTNLDDLRHDINCFQTEMQILDGRIKYFENALASLKQQDLEKQQSRIEQLSLQIQAFEKKWGTAEKRNEVAGKELEGLTKYAAETTTALSQFKGRIEELEQELFSQSKKMGTLAKSLKPNDMQSYKVCAGDSLEKIAKTHNTTVEKIKKLNQLENDKIVVGQELKIPQ